MPTLLLLSVAISSYPLCTLPTPSFLPIATYTPQIMPYFEVEWAQKWVQSTTTITTTAILKRQLRIPTRELFRDSNSLELGVANGHFQRPEEPLATLIGPLMDPRPLPCKPLPEVPDFPLPMSSQLSASRLRKPMRNLLQLRVWEVALVL